MGSFVELNQLKLQTQLFRKRCDVLIAGIITPDPFQILECFA